MFNKIIAALSDMWAQKRTACWIAIGYVVFMIAFFVVGITKAQIDTLVAVTLLTGIYALVVWFVKKIIG